MSMYKTNQRDAILKFLSENLKNHVTVDDAVFYMKQNGFSVGRTTIYRYFENLQVEGRLRKFIGCENKCACYQFIEETEKCKNHYHFICDSCNELFHIDCKFLDKVEAHVLKSHIFKIDCLKTTFHGYCERCLEKV